MPETLTVDGRPVDLDDSEQRFAAAMAAPPADAPEAAAPPKRDAPDPEAPYGRKADGTPRKSRPGPGRPPKPRMIEAPKDQDQGKAKASTAQDYTTGLTEFTDALWMVMAATPIPHDSMRVRIRAQAYVLKTNQAGVVTSVNTMAQHNATIRGGVEKLTMGSAGWVLPAVMALAPFAVQSAAIWRAPVEGDMRTLADQTEADWSATFAAMQADLVKAQQEAADQAAAAERFERADSAV
jgi:hypothetical protein